MMSLDILRLLPLVIILVEYAAASKEGLPCFSWSALPRNKYKCSSLKDGLYNVYHTLEKDGNITFGIEVKQPDPHMPLDWIGFGISEAGGMRAADIILLRRTQSGEWGVQDRWADDFATPVLDTTQNVRLRAASYAGGILRALVTRPLDSCDPQDLRIEVKLPTTVIWAFGSGWGVGTFRQHDNSDRGNALITFDSPAALAAAHTAPPQVATISVGGGGSSRRALRHTDSASETSLVPHSAAETGGEIVMECLIPEYNITQEDDQYVCVDFRLPNDRKRHITAFEGLLRGAPANVHHIVLFACVKQPPTFGTGPYRCEGMPVNCLSLVMHWVPGKGLDTFPEQAGYALGPGGLEHVTLQMHYNNVAGAQGRVDRSGVRLYVTETLRPHDMGTLLLGHMGMSIPPAQPVYALPPSVCPAECTSQWPSPLNVWATALHMHKLGRSARLRHVRNGTELRPLASMQAYDFNYQPVQPAPHDTATILPGDVLLTECTYDSTRRPGNTTTYWGEGTADEMCFAVVMYWPRLPRVDSCLTISSRTQWRNMATCSGLNDLFASFLEPGTNWATSIMRLVSNGGIVLSSGVKPFTPYNTTGPQCVARMRAERGLRV